MKIVQQLRALRLRDRLTSHRIRAAKVWLLLAALVSLIVVGGHAIDRRYGLLFGFFAALGLGLWVLFYSELRLNRLFHCTELEGQDPWGLRYEMAALADTAGVSPPRIFVIQQDSLLQVGAPPPRAPTSSQERSLSPLIYSTGLLSFQNSVFVSEELLQRFSREEIKTLFLHELLRFRNNQTATATVAAALGRLLTSFATAIDSIVFLQALHRRRPGQIRPVELLISPLLSFIVRFPLGRRSVLHLDQETLRASKSILGSEQAFPRALWKLDAYAKAKPIPVGFAEAHLFATNPLARFWWYEVLGLQPPIEARIRNLVGHSPL